MILTYGTFTSPVLCQVCRYPKYHFDTVETLGGFIKHVVICCEDCAYRIEKEKENNIMNGTDSY